MTEASRLESWKEIAQYLGRDVRTAMRWEAERGLPVRRVPGSKRSGVFAYREELDAWLALNPPGNGDRVVETPDASGRPRFRLTRRALLVTAGGLLVLVASGVAFERIRAVSPDLSTAAVAGEELVAFDAGGREAWRHRFPHIDGNIVLQRAAVTDVTGDGRRDVLAAVHFMAHGGQAYGSVMLFDHQGRLRWERSLEDRYTFGDVEYAPAWFPEDIVTYRSGGATRIAVANHHHTWWPGVVATYDEDGTLLHRFVNAGWIRSLNVTPDGRYLLAAGISNSFDGAALAVLDAANPVGSSPTTGGTLPACANCPAGAPVAYFVTPWTGLARPSDTPPVVVHVTRAGVIEWRAVQRAVADGKVPELIVSFSPELEILQRGVNEYFQETQALLEETGAAPRTGADWRNAPVRRWTPATGWAELTTMR